mgnify:CR=1 FL=1
MPRDTFVSWKTLALFVLFPPLALVAIVFFPVTIGVALWLYYRGKNEARLEELDAASTEQADS